MKQFLGFISFKFPKKYISLAKKIVIDNQLLIIDVNMGFVYEVEEFLLQGLFGPLKQWIFTIYAVALLARSQFTD